jgi:hypothetical protein
MKAIKILGTILLLVTIGTAGVMAKDKDTREYYTQHNIWLFKNQSSSVNYAVEALIPVNSKVSIVKENDERLVLKMGDAEFTVVLVRKHTRIKMDDFKKRLLKETPVDLSKFSKSAQDHIRSGQIVPGMTKAEVLIARGYPPDNATISTDVDTWKYWQSKFNTILVYFDGDKVRDIKN